MAIRTPEEKVQILSRMAGELNAAMPTDVMLKGDGTIWITEHGNAGIRPREIKQQDVLELIYRAIEYSNMLISIQIGDVKLRVDYQPPEGMILVNREELESLLDDLLDWADYTPEYFKEKHNLEKYREQARKMIGESE